MCRLPADHMNVYDAKGLWDEQACPHFDPKHNHHWTGPLLQAFDVETKRRTKAGAVKVKKAVRLCKKCSKQVRTDGASDACVCKETGADKRQAILFADERELLAREKTMDEMQSDIDSLMAQWKREEEPYFAEF